MPFTISAAWNWLEIQPEMVIFLPSSRTSRIGPSGIAGSGAGAGAGGVTAGGVGAAATGGGVGAGGGDSTWGCWGGAGILTGASQETATISAESAAETRRNRKIWRERFDMTPILSGFPKNSIPLMDSESRGSGG
jgi:hypothetical protein